MRQLTVLLFLLAPLSVARADPPAQPNVVFLLADDLGREDCGFMGGKEIKTPNIDKIAAAGATLDAFYVQPVCSPTRAALMTGRYPMRHGLQVGVVRPWAQYGLPLDERTVAEGLKDAGYTTAVIGKWHLGHFAPEYLPTKRGFDHQYGHYNGALDYFTHVRDGGFDWHRDDKVNRDEGYSTHLIAKGAVQFVQQHAGKKPFFLYVPFNAVHAPHQVPDEYLKPYAHLKGERQKYAGMLAAMDEAVGQIVAAVEQAGVRKNTLFVFLSDNGGPQPGVVTSNGKFRAGKGTLYEGGVRVAACAAFDGHIKPGTTITEPLHVVDWYPTLLKLAGTKGKPQLPIDGLDIWPVLTGGKPSPHGAILLNTTPNTGAVRAGDWKLVVKNGTDDPDGAVTKSPSKASVELFNLKDDPFEKTNLAEKHADKVSELREVLAGFAKQAVPPKAAPKPKGFVSPKVWGEKD
ncbi:arylsulfatase [Gemmata sp. JC673]|uniref:Arylsulfatase n=1 Tax=Gemmata algarum TaxID=2975278 RepID=A0ABU5F569_9BACT|nr:arylsulfatase [Gemmata algarum]MDY3562728.1 arylsulfatase [Gemmata algarum]